MSKPDDRATVKAANVNGKWYLISAVSVALIGGAFSLFNSSGGVTQNANNGGANNSGANANIATEGGTIKVFPLSNPYAW